MGRFNDRFSNNNGNRRQDNYQRRDNRDRYNNNRGDNRDNSLMNTRSFSDELNARLNGRRFSDVRNSMKSDKHEEPVRKDDNKPKEVRNNPRANAEILDEFTKKIRNNIKSPADIRDILREDIALVSKIISNYYYDKKYDGVIDSFNNTLSVLGTNVVASCMKDVVRDDSIDCESVDTLTKNLGIMISLTLLRLPDEMSNEAVSKYVDTLSDYLFTDDIQKITEKFAVSDDVAIDLVINVPTFGVSMTDMELREYGPNFLATIMDYSDAVIDVMDAENIKGLMKFFFVEDKKNLLKFIGRSFCAPRIHYSDDDLEKRAIYDEYAKAMYEILNEHEIEEIRYVLSHIAAHLESLKAKKSKEKILFSANFILDEYDKDGSYDTLMKAFESFFKQGNNQKYASLFDEE